MGYHFTLRNTNSVVSAVAPTDMFEYAMKRKYYNKGVFINIYLSRDVSFEDDTTFVDPMVTEVFLFHRLRSAGK